MSSPSTTTSPVSPAISFLVQDPLSSEDEDGDTSFQAEDEDIELDSSSVSSSDSGSDSDPEDDDEMDASSSTSDDKNMLAELPTPILKHSKLNPKFSACAPGTTIVTWALDDSLEQNKEDEAYIVKRTKEIEEEYRARLGVLAGGVGKGFGEGVEGMKIEE